MVGTKGVVTQTLENGHGKVKLGDSVWLAPGLTPQLDWIRECRAPWFQYRLLHKALAPFEHKIPILLF